MGQLVLLRGFGVVGLLLQDTPAANALVCVVPGCIFERLDPLLDLCCCY